MTQAQELLARRRAKWSMPVEGKKKSGGAGLASLFGGGAPVGDVMADQGPGLYDAATYTGAEMPGDYAGGVGKPFLSLGDPNKGQIKIGPFLRPRVDQDAAAILAKDPLAPVKLEKETKGIGGFFRNLLGDNANERNAARAENQGAMSAVKWKIDQDYKARNELAANEHALELARDAARFDQQTKIEKLRAEQAASQTQYETTLGLQGDQLKMKWALEQARKASEQGQAMEHQQLTDALGDPIQASNYRARKLTVPLDYQESQTKQNLAHAHALTTPKVGTGLNGHKAPVGAGYDPDSDSYTLLEDGKIVRIPRGIIQPNVEGTTPVGYSKDGRLLQPPGMQQEFKQVDQQEKIEALRAPSSVMEGLGALGGELFNGGKAAFGTLPQGQAINHTFGLGRSAVQAPLNLIRGFGDMTKQLQLQEIEGQESQVQNELLKQELLRRQRSQTNSVPTGH